MPNYSPELVASVLHEYVHTDKPIGQIARDHQINERDVTRIRHAAGCPPRGARVRALPPEMRELHEATTRLKAEAPPIAPADAVGELDAALGGDGALSPRVEGGLAGLIARVQRLVEQELAAEEATRAALGSLARTPTELERCARTVASMTRTLHVLLRMGASAAPEQAPFNHDLPEDADEIRNELARRIEAFLASRPADGGAGGAAGATSVAG